MKSALHPSGNQRAVLRAVDANFNRAREALRVLEDISRFLVGNKSLTSRLKALRHQMTQALLKFPATYRQLLEARNSEGDVGKKSWIPDSRRSGIHALWISNMKRAQEALRALEEFSKAAAPRRSPEFQKIRFSLYELEKKSFRFF